MYCGMLVLEISKKLGLNSYPKIGEKLFGKKGLYAVNLSLWSSQVGFCCAYVYFNIVNLSQIFYFAGSIDISRNWFVLGFFVLWALLCFVRRLEIFASTHIFADIVIFIAIITIMAYGGVKLKNEGSQFETIPPFNPETFTDAIGFSIYSYEGIGMIMPVRDVVKEPDQYWKIVVAVISTVIGLYVIFGEFCVFAWGSQMTTPLISDNLPHDPVAYVVKILFVLNLIFSYPLQIYPATIILENIFFKNMPRTPKRQFLKNIVRTILVGITVAITVLLGDKLDSFLAIVGALTCTPIAFTFPGLFHYYVCAETTR